MIIIQCFGSKIRVSDILYEEKITNVPVSNADPFAVKVSVNSAPVDEAPGVGSVILLSPIKNPVTEEFPVVEILMQEYLLNRLSGENGMKVSTSPLRTMLNTPINEETCSRQSGPNHTTLDETNEHENPIIIMIEPLAVLFL